MGNNNRKLLKLFLVLFTFGIFVSVIVSHGNFPINREIDSLPQKNDFAITKNAAPEMVNGLGTNLPVTLFLEKTYQLIDLEVKNSETDESQEGIYSIPSLSGYEVYQVNVTIGSENLTALRNYQFSTLDTSETTTIQGGGFPNFEAGGQEFSLPYRSRIYNTTIYMAIAGLYADNNGTVEFRDSSPSGNIMTAQVIPVVSLGSSVWHTHNWNLIINDTSHSYEFVVNGTSIGGTGRQYWWYHSATGGVALNADVKIYTFGWSNAQYDYTFKFCYLPLNDTGTSARNFTVPEADLKVNGTSVGADNTLVLNGQISALNFTANTSVNINDMSIRVFYRRTTEQTTQTTFEVDADNPTVKWNVSKTLTFPADSSNCGINFSLPIDWNVENVLNATAATPVVYANWQNVTNSARIVTVQDIRNGTWLVNCTGHNYLTAISYEKDVSGSFVLQSENATLLITDMIRINGTVEDGNNNPETTGNGNLSVFFSNQTRAYSENNTAPSASGILTFSNWTISNNAYDNDTYSIQVFWTNGTEVGLNVTYFKVIYPTNLTTHVDSVEYTAGTPLDRYIGDEINVTSFYNNTFNPLTGGISTIYADYRIENASSGLWVDWTALDLENLGTGYYNRTFDTTSWTAGVYYILLNCSKPWYISQSENITINLLNRPSDLTIFLNQTQSNFISIYSNQTVDITAYFEDIYHTVSLPGASVNLTVLYNNTMYEMTDGGNGNYTWTFDGWQWGPQVSLPYNFTILVNGTRWDANYNETSLTIQIINDPPVIVATQTNQTATMYRNEVIQVNATVTDLEDISPDLTVFLCIDIPSGGWNNISMTYQGSNFFEYNFTIPTLDIYLGQIEVRIRANDSDNSWVETSLGNVNILNNNPSITGVLSNHTSTMRRNQTIQINCTILDIEDSAVGLQGYLALNLSDASWYNVSLNNLGANIFGVNFTLLNGDNWLGPINLYIYGEDTDLGYTISTLIDTIVVENNPPLIMNSLNNATASMYRGDTFEINCSITDIEDLYPNLNGTLSIRLNDSSWYNSSLNHISGSLYALNFTLPLLDIFLNDIDVYISALDSENGYFITALLFTIHVQNNIPVIQNTGSNQTVTMYRAEVLRVNSTSYDREDLYPNLTSFLCILDNASVWTNISMSFLGSNYYEYNYTLPSTDAFLGTITVRVRINDSEGAWVESSLGIINVLNNIPTISGILSNHTATMKRSQTLQINGTILDTEDVSPALQGYLALNLSDSSWYNVSLNYLGFNIFGVNFTLLNQDNFLGLIHLYIYSTDSDGGYEISTLIDTIFVENNLPQIQTPTHNATASLFRGGTFEIECNITDIEDLYPNLNGTLSIRLNDSSWYNTSLNYLTNNLYGLNFTIPLQDIFLNDIDLYISALDSDSGYSLTNLIITINIKNNIPNIQSTASNQTASMYRSDVIRLNGTVTDREDISPNLTLSLCVRYNISSWNNQTMTYLGSDYFEINFTIPFSNDDYLGTITLFVKARDSEGAINETLIGSVTVLNNNPVVSNILSNYTLNMKRSEVFELNCSIVDVEDVSPALQGYLAINRSDSSWYNVSLTYLSNDIFGLNFSWPVDDLFLGDNMLYVYAIDSDGGYDISSLIATINVENNAPNIQNPLHNMTLTMYRGEIISINCSINDIEDVYPNLNGSLNLQLNDSSWYNTSLLHISGSLYALNFTLPLQDSFLNDVDVYISAIDSEGALTITGLIFTVEILNNLPQVLNPKINVTGSVYRGEVLWVNASILDTEDDNSTGLTGTLCLNLQGGSWYNTSLQYISGDLYEINFTLPLGDQYLGTINVYVRGDDSDGGTAESSLGSISVLNNPPTISTAYSNHTSQLYRNDTIYVNCSASDIEDLPPTNLTGYLCLNLSSSTWYNVSLSYSGGGLFELNWTIPDQDLFNGTIFVYVRVNDTEGDRDLFGLGTMEVIGRPTNTSIFLSESSGKYIEINFADIINITAYYYQTLTSSPLTNANVRITCLTNVSIAQNQAMDNRGSGNYSFTFDPDYADRYDFQIDAYQSGFQVNQSLLTVLVRERTNFTIYMNGTVNTFYEVFYDQVLNITAFYFNLSSGGGIDTASVNLSVLVNNSIYSMSNNGNGNYSFLFDASSWYQEVGSLPYNYTIKINATAQDFEYFEQSIIVKIKPKPTALTTYLNGSILVDQIIYYNESLYITAYYNDTTLVSGIGGASVNISQTPMTEDLTNTGNYTYIFNGTQIGDFQFLINTSKYGYVYAEINITVHVIERLTAMRVYINNTETLSTNVFYNESLVITAYYYDLLRNTGIASAVVNLSNGLTYPMVDVPAEQGNYSVSYNADMVGVLIYDVNASIYGYRFNSTQIQITVQNRPTAMRIFVNDSETYDIAAYYNESLRIDAYYYDLLRDVGITTATLNLTNSGVYDLSPVPVEDGNYTLLYNLTSVGIFSLLLNGSKYGYSFNSTLLQLQVQNRPTAMKLYVNGTETYSSSAYYNESLVITAYYYDVLRSVGIGAAILNLSNSQTYGLAAVPSEAGNYSMIYNISTVGNFIFDINGSKYGYVFNLTQLNLTFQSRLTGIRIHVNGTETVSTNVDYNETLIIKAYYYDVLRGVGISSAVLNMSNGLTYSLSAVPAEPGNYSMIYNSTLVGNLIYSVNASKFGYAFNSTQLQINVQNRATAIRIFVNGSESYNTAMYFNESLIITAFYYDVVRGSGIDTAILNFSNGAVNSMVAVPAEQGNYTLTYNATAPGSFFYDVNASKYGYSFNSTQIQITVLNRLTGIRIFVNDSETYDTSAYFNESLVITAYYYDVLRGEGIDLAVLNLSNAATYDLVSVPAETGNYSMIYNTTSVGLSVYSINGSKYGYSFNSTALQLTILNRPTAMKIFVNDTETYNTAAYFDESLVIKVYYYDIFRDVGIDSALVNFSNGLTYGLNPVPSEQGNYSMIYNTTLLGNLGFDLNASKYGYSFNSTQLLLTVNSRPTGMRIYLNGTETYDRNVYYNESLLVTAYYYDILRNAGIVSSVVNLSNGATYSLTEVALQDGNYSILYNYTVLGSQTYNLNASIYGYDFNSTQFNVTVLPHSTGLQIYLNGTAGVETSLYFNGSLEIIAFYNDTYLNEGIVAASVNISASSPMMETINQGNYSYLYNASDPGDYEFIINASKYGFVYAEINITIHVLNYQPLIIDTGSNHSTTIYRADIINVNVTTTDPEDVYPNLTATLCLNLSSSVWVNTSMNFISGNLFAINYTLLNSDSFLGLIHIYVRVNDSDGAVAESLVGTTTCLNNEPTIVSPQSNQTAVMSRGEALLVNASIYDTEDSPPTNLTAFLCIRIPAGGWNNISITPVGNFFEETFVIPLTDNYLGVMEVIIAANDTDNARVEVFLGNVTVINNIPNIFNIQSNHTSTMQRGETIRINSTIQDREDINPALTGTLCLFLQNGTWYNTSLTYLAGNLFEINLTLLLEDGFLGAINMYISSLDSDGGYNVSSLIDTINVINNDPQILTPLTNASGNLYRGDVIHVNASLIDLEDVNATGLVGFLCLHLSDSSWENISLQYIAGDLYALNYTIPKDDRFLNDVDIHIQSSDSDNGYVLSAVLSTINILNNPPVIQPPQTNASVSQYRADVVHFNVSISDYEDLYPNITAYLAVNRSSGQWYNTTMTYIGSNLFAINFSIPVDDSFLGTTQFYISSNDSDAGYAFSSLVATIVIENNAPIILNSQSNATPSMFRNQIFEVETNISDAEDVNPALGGSLCIQLPSSGWINTSLNYISNNLYGINYTLPLQDSILGNINIYVQGVDSDGGYILALVTAIQVLNNLPQISGSTHNASASMYRGETFELTVLITDLEDTNPDLNGSLCIRLPSNAWYNTSLNYISGNLYGANLTLPLLDTFLGDIDVFVQARDSDSGYRLSSLITTINCLNNQPQISGPTHNATTSMYRGETINLTVSLTDIEDSNPDLNGSLCLQLQDNSWINTSLTHLGGDLFVIVYDLPLLDSFLGSVDVYVETRDSDFGYALSALLTTINVANNLPQISGPTHNATVTMYRGETIHINCTLTDIEDIYPNLNGTLALQLNDSSWVNTSLQFISGNFYALNYTLPFGDQFLNDIDVYITAIDSENALVSTALITTISIQNNIPNIQTIGSNQTATMYRAETINVNATVLDSEDISPNLTVYLCVRDNTSTWTNLSMSYLGSNIFDINFTLPVTDAFLDQILVKVRAVDSEGATIETLIGIINILNNQPQILGTGHNASAVLNRTATIAFNATINDVEDNVPNLVAFLAVNRSSGMWYNVSMTYLGSDIFAINFSIPLDDSFLGLTQFYISTNDTDSGYAFSALITSVNILNNIPAIIQIRSNHTSFMYRSQTLWINSTINDVEDISPNLTAYLCINRTSTGWYNVSMPYSGANLFNINFTLPNDDSFIDLLILYIFTNDTDGGVVFSAPFASINCLNNLPSITGSSHNVTTPITRNTTVEIRANVSDVEDFYPNLDIILAVNRSDSVWINLTMSYISGDLYALNYSIPNQDIFLGLLQFYISQNDTDRGYVLTLIATTTVENNPPQIATAYSNHTAQMFRNETIYVNCSASDIEDLPPIDLQAFLCMNLSSSTWYNVSLTYSGGSLFELNWAIPNSDTFNGLIFLYINTTDSEGSGDLFALGAVEVIRRPTNITVYLNGTEGLFSTIDYDATINFTAYYYETAGSSGLNKADVLISCTSHPPVAFNTPMDNIGLGNYSFHFDPTSGGLYNFRINANYTGYVTQQILFSVRVRGDTNFTVYMNSSVTDYQQIYYDQILNITVFYGNSTGGGIPTAQMNLTVVVNNTLYNMVNQGNGNYSWIFDASSWYQEVSNLPYNFTMKINASAPSFQYFEQFVTIRILRKPTALTTYLNDSVLNDFSVQFNESVVITAYYNDTDILSGILGASVNITAGSPMAETSGGNYTYLFNASTPGDFTFIINATLHGYTYAQTSIIIHVLNYVPVISTSNSNHTPTVYRLDVLQVNSTVIDPEDVYPNLTVYLCLNLSSSSWINSSMSHISGNLFAINHSLSTSDAFLGLIYIYIRANDSNGGVSETLVGTTTCLNNKPSIFTPLSNQTPSMYRGEEINVSAMIFDIEDSPPTDLTAFLCIRIPAGGWNNISMGVAGSFFQQSFVIPLSDLYLGVMEVIIAANDTEGALTEVSMGTVTILNNAPSITNQNSNQTGIMSRSETISVTANLNDLEDTYPNYTTTLSVYINTAFWDNRTMLSLGGDLFGYNYTISNLDSYLGSLEVFIVVNDSEGLLTALPMGVVNVINNNPQISNPSYNATATMYRGETVQINCTLTDIEDIYPNLNGTLALHLSDSSWVNISLEFISDSLYALDYTIPYDDLFLNDIDIYLTAIDSDGGFSSTALLITITVLNVLPDIPTTGSNQTATMYRSEAIKVNATVIDGEDLSPNLTSYLCIRDNTSTWTNQSMNYLGSDIFEQTFVIPTTDSFIGQILVRVRAVDSEGNSFETTVGIINVLNNLPIISNIQTNHTPTMKRSDTIQINCTIVDVEDVSPTLQGYLSIQLNDSSWSNSSLTFVGSNKFAINFTIPNLDLFLNDVDLYIYITDSDSAYVLTALNVTIRLENNAPVIQNPQTNAPASMFRNQIFEVTANISDIEDVNPALGGSLCIQLPNSAWMNTSLNFLSNSLYGINYTLPISDNILGNISVYIQGLDSDGGYVLTPLIVSILVFNNLPQISGTGHNASDSMYRGETIELTSLLTDVEDVNPDLNGSLCIRLPSSVWVNSSLNYISGNQFGLNFSIPFLDAFLGSINIFVQAQDSDNGYRLSALIKSIIVLNNQPQISAPSHNASATMYRGETLNLTVSLADLEDVSLNGSLCLHLQDNSWINTSLNHLSGSIYGINYTLPLLDSLLGDVDLYIESRDSDSGYAISALLATVQCLNNQPLILTTNSNASSQMVRGVVINVNASASDLEDSYPNMTTFLCVNYNGGADWDNISMSYEGSNYFEYNYSISLLDPYLGLMRLFVRVNDSDSGWIETSLANVTIINNAPSISGILSNHTPTMLRGETIRLNCSILDVEDNFPALQGYLAVNLSDMTWYNITLNNLGGDLFGIDFDLLLNDSFLGSIDIYVYAIDSEAAYNLSAVVGTILVANNEPLIQTPQHNASSIMYRGDTISINCSLFDVEDNFPALNGTLALQLNDSSWFNTSLVFVSGNLHALNFTLPLSDQFLNDVDVYLSVVDSDSGYNITTRLITISVYNNIPIIQNTGSNGTASMLRGETINVNVTGSDREDTYPNLTAFLCIRYNISSWNNQSMAFLGTYYESNFSVPLIDEYLGAIEVIVRLNDTDGAYMENSLGFININNNLPVINNAISNHTLTMFRNETISIVVNISDLEDAPPIDLTSQLCLNLSSGTWENYSMIFSGGETFTYDWTIPDLDLYEGIIHIYVCVNDSDLGLQTQFMGTTTVLKRPTNATGFLNGTQTLSTLINVDETIELVIYYEEIQSFNPLIDASVLITCTTNFAIALNTPMGNPGNGNYTFLFDPISGGQFLFEVTASRTGFETQIVQFTIFVQGTTNFTIYMNGVEDVDNYFELYFDEMVNITTWYFNTTGNVGIPSANLSATVQVNNSLYTMTELGSGNYSFIFDASMWYQTVGSLPYDFIIKINASHPSFQYFEEFVTIRILPKPVNLSIFVNDAALQDHTIYYNQTVNITAFYEDLPASTGIGGAFVNLSTVPMSPSLTNIGNYSSLFMGNQLGDFQFRINASKYGYAYIEKTLTIHVVERPTTLTVYVNDVQTQNTTLYYNESTQIIAYYHDLVDVLGIDLAVVNITEGITTNMNELSLGNYSILYSTNQLGIFTFQVNASKYGYALNSTTLQVTVIERPTTIIPYANGTSSSNYSVYLNQTLDFVFTYQDILRSIGISNALVNATNQTLIWGLSENPSLSGNYTFTFNATNVGNYTLLINASRYGYVFDSVTVSVSVLRRPVNLSISLNAILGDRITIDIGDSVDIELVFRDNLTGQGVPGVLVNITWNPSYEGYTDVNGTFKFIFNATASGTYILQIRVEKDGFTILQQNVTITVRAAEPPGDDTWLFIVIGSVVGAVVTVVTVMRSRRKEEPAPTPPEEPGKRRKGPSLTDLLKVKLSVIQHRNSETILVIDTLQPDKVTKQEKADLFKALPTLKDSKLESRIVLQETIQILYHDGDWIRVAFLIEDRPSPSFFKSHFEFTKQFELSYEPQLKELPDDLSVFGSGLTKELQNTLLNYQLLLPHRVRKDQQFLRTLPSLQKKIVRHATNLSKETGTFKLMDLIEEVTTSLKMDLLRILEEVEALWLLDILIPETDMDDAEREQIFSMKRNIADRIQKDQQDRLTEQINEATMAALEQMKDEKYVDAAIYYETAAQAAKELGNEEDYEKYIAKGAECINLKLAIINKMEEKKKPKKKVEKREEKVEKEEFTDEELDKEINQLLKDSGGSYMSIVDIAQMLGISVVKAAEVAKKSGYHVTEKRIYQKGIEPEKEEDLDAELREHLNILMAETEKAILISLVVKRLGVPEEKVRQLAETEGYEVTKTRIKRKK